MLFLIIFFPQILLLKLNLNKLYGKLSKTGVPSVKSGLYIYIYIYIYECSSIQYPAVQQERERKRRGTTQEANQYNPRYYPIQSKTLTVTNIVYVRQKWDARHENTCAGNSYKRHVLGAAVVRQISLLVYAILFSFVFIIVRQPFHTNYN